MTAKDVYSFAARKLAQLLGMTNAGQQKAMLAELRRGVGKEPGDLPNLWGILLEGMPEDMMGKSRAASSAEWSIYTALTLFAVHQQGCDPKTEPMHVQNGEGLGAAVGTLAATDDERERITRRFNQAVTATERAELSHHLRGLCQLLRQEGVSMDYAKLAQDLFLYQSENYQSQVRLRWGEDFYRSINKNLNDRKDEDNE